MLKKIMVRLQNKKIAMAVASGILLVLVNMGVIDVEMSVKAETTVNTVLGVLVALGIVSDPESHIK